MASLNYFFKTFKIRNVKNYTIKKTTSIIEVVFLNGRRVVLFFFLIGMYSKRQIKRAEADQACKNKYSRQNQKYYPKGSCNYIGKIQNCNKHSNRNPDNFVSSSHV